MNILLYKRDLETFSNKDIYSLARYYNLTNKDVNDLRWEIALRHSQKNQMLTGNYFIDTDILQSLSDEDLAAACSVDKIAKKICESDDFWMQRAFDRFEYDGDLGNFTSARDLYNYLKEKLSEIKNRTKADAFNVPLQVLRDSYYNIFEFLMKTPKLQKSITDNVIMLFAAEVGPDYLSDLMKYRKFPENVAEFFARSGLTDHVKWTFENDYSLIGAARAAANQGHLDTLKYLVSIKAPHEQAINHTSDPEIFKYLYDLGFTPDQDTVDGMFDPVDPDISMMLAKDNYFPSQEKIDDSYITADDPELFKFFAENYGITPSDNAKHMRNLLNKDDMDL